MSKLLSVIVPIYNVEPYLESCISSICSQTYKNLEILLVDDGATDNSGSICETWAKKDERIRVFHIKNGGQSVARNVGLANAKGELIGFVDGDDAITPKMYEVLAVLLEKEQAEIAECNFIGRKVAEPDVMEDGALIMLSGREALFQHLNINARRRFPSSSVWSKLFRRELLEGLQFPEGRVHEEYAFLSEAMYRCKKYVYINEHLYERTLRGDSTTAAPFSVKALDKLAVFQERERFFEKQGETQLLSLSRAQRYDMMLYFYHESKKHSMVNEAKSLRRQLIQEKKFVIKSPLSFKRRVLLCLLIVCGKGYDVIWKIWKG